MPYVADPTLGLVFGALDLLGHDQTGPYWFETTADGTEWGTPDPLIREVTTFLQDGALETTESYGNREMTLKVLITGEDSYGLSAGEKALMAEVNKRNTLTWTPPNILTGSGAACVFDVVDSHLEHALDDLDELYLQRAYTVTIKALPFARADTAVSVTSLAPPSTTPTVVSIDTCTSLTGWSATPAGASTTTAVIGGAAVKATFTRSTGTGTLTPVLRFIRSGLSANMSATPYVRLDFSTAVTGAAATVPSAIVYLNGAATAATAQNGSVGWYRSPATTLTEVRVEQQATINNPGTVGVTVNDISRSDVPSDLPGGQRQSYRSIAIDGSVRTQGNLLLADPAVALGSVLVYTTPTAGIQPPLRALRTSGSTETTDSSMVSGKSSDLATLHTFDIPAASVPAAGYLLMARVKHASAGARTLTWAGRSRVGSTNDTGVSGTQSVTLAAGVWTIVPVAMLALPTRQVGPSGLVRIELTGPSGLLLDEAWIFNVTDGRLTWVECGTATPASGGPANRLWLDAASLASPQPSVWMGTAADRSDAMHAGPVMQAFGDHEFVPPSTNVFTVVTNSVATDVTLTCYNRYHTHVA